MAPGQCKWKREGAELGKIIGAFELTATNTIHTPQKDKKKKERKPG